MGKKEIKLPDVNPEFIMGVLFGLIGIIGLVILLILSI